MKTNYNCTDQKQQRFFYSSLHLEGLLRGALGSIILALGQKPASSVCAARKLDMNWFL